MGWHPPVHPDRFVAVTGYHGCQENVPFFDLYFYNHLYHPSVFRNLLLKSGIILVINSSINGMFSNWHCHIIYSKHQSHIQHDVNVTP